MGKMEFGLDLIQVSHVIFGCINISGIVPDAVALAASPGIPPERGVQTSAPKERRLLSPFSVWTVGVQLAILLPSYFVPVYLAYIWMQKAVPHIVLGNYTMYL